MVVAPLTVDVDKALLSPLLAQAQLLYNPQRSRVLGSDVYLHSVQSEFGEEVVYCHRHRNRND